MKKIMMLATILVAGLFIMPNVYAEYNGETGTVTENSGKDSVGDSNVTGVVDSTDPKNVVITYNALSLKVIGQNDGGQNRGKDAAWVGFHIETPTGAEVSTAKFKVGDDATFGNTADKDGNYYFSITAEDLQKAIDSGTPIIKKISFSWDGTGDEVDQTVTIIIDPAKVVLTAKDSDEVEFNGPEEKQQLDEQKAKEAEAAAAKEEKEENNPNTSDINLYLLLSLIAVSGCGIAYTVKRRFN